MPSSESIELGWGMLRSADARDRYFAESCAIEGQLSGTSTDGSSTTIDYSGNIVLDTTLEYRVVLRDFDLKKPWPASLAMYEEVQRQVESVQLGALLTEAYNTTEPITLLPTWRYIHDPLNHGYGVGWSDPRMYSVIHAQTAGCRQCPQLEGVHDFDRTPP